MQTDAPFRAGFVALIGLPNVGKSTLLNALVGERLSIVTPKAQTTQRKHLGIYSDEGHQAVFIDTPGLLEPRYTLQRSMREEALSALDDADVVVAVMDAGFDKSVDWVSAFGPSLASPKLLCINKCDRLSTSDLEGLERSFAAQDWTGMLRTTGTTGDGISDLRTAILAELPESPALYPTDELSDAPVRDFVAEMIRETCLEELDEEVPYSVAVQVEQFKERPGGKPTYIEALIFVERDSQKGIVVGKGGATIRKIGSRSRPKIEQFLDHKVYLELRVKVLPNWRKRANQLRVLGFRVPAEEK
jgi:GTP-binding protein Era